MSERCLGECYLMAGILLWVMGINEFKNTSKEPNMMVVGAQVMTAAFEMILHASHGDRSGRYGLRGPYDIEKSPAYINLMLRQPNERWFRDALRSVSFS